MKNVIKDKTKKGNIIPKYIQENRHNCNKIKCLVKICGKEMSFNVKSIGADLSLVSS